jgi:RNA polymerase sigma factor (sigma-70 family)
MTLAELVQLFEDWVWDLQAEDLQPREREFLCHCDLAGKRLEEVMEDSNTLDVTLALALQKGFFVSKVFVELFQRRYEDRFLYWLSYCDKDEHRRHDVVQQFYLKFWQRVGRTDGQVLCGFDPRRIFRSWIRKALINFWIARVYRKRDQEPRTEEDEQEGPDTVLPPMIARERKERLWDAVSKLLPEEKRVMELILRGYTPKQIAEIMHISLNRVYRLYHKALEHLRRLLESDGPHE